MFYREPAFVFGNVSWIDGKNITFAFGALAKSLFITKKCIKDFSDF